jgi:hypothetical protein
MAEKVFPTTTGNYPPMLYRAFSEREHAEAFLQGRVRLGLLSFYKRIEDEKRQDDREGESSLLIPDQVLTLEIEPATKACVRKYMRPGYIHRSDEWLNPIYVLCCSYPPTRDDSLIPMSFGQFVVRIHEPRRFGHDLAEAIASHGAIPAWPQVECVKIEYTKGGRVPTRPPDEELARLAYSQKTPGFNEEYEYRLVVRCRYSDQPPEHIEVSLEKSLDYASLMVFPTQ